jgi:hypothetical protein
MHPSLDGARLTLLNPLFRLLFCIRHVLGHYVLSIVMMLSNIAMK